MFVFKSTYNAVVRDFEIATRNFQNSVKEVYALRDVIKQLRIELEEAKKNDHRDAKGKFTKAPAKPKKCKVK